MYFVLCRLYPSSPQPALQCLAPTCLDRKQNTLTPTGIDEYSPWKMSKNSQAFLPSYCILPASSPFLLPTTRCKAFICITGRRKVKENKWEVVIISVLGGGRFTTIKSWHRKKRLSPFVSLILSIQIKPDLKCQMRTKEPNPTIIFPLAKLYAVSSMVVLFH